MRLMATSCPSPLKEASVQRRSQNGHLVAVSTRLPADLVTLLEDLTPPTGSMASTVRDLLTFALARRESDAVIAQLFADALAEQRRHIQTLLRVVMLNVVDGATETEVRTAIEQLEEDGLI